MKENIFSTQDIRQIQTSGIDPAKVEDQLETYRNGASYLKLNRPCYVDDGIVSLAPVEQNKLIDIYDNEAGFYKVIKFVPASGAASRMFTDWFSAVEKKGFGTKEIDKKFLKNFKKYPFFSLIADNKSSLELLEKKDIPNLLKFILGKEGLNYGNLPKALIPFHRYPDGKLRTALEEHLAEAAGYIPVTGGARYLHFTISAEHKEVISKCVEEIIQRYKEVNQINYSIALSFQSSSTNTIAVDEENRPLRNDKGELVFRPGGHGALLDNLNDLDADLIFVKNIDNVIPQVLLEKIIPFKKMLGGMALKIQKETFSLLRSLESDEQDADIEKIVTYCSQTLNIVFPADFKQQAKAKKVRTIFNLLNRPLRICGVVKNNGEPGGGPFWVDGENGTQTLQIVESAHVDKNNAEQSTIWSQSQFFNPVDMVCCIKNYKGQKFKLNDFVDKKACLITIKNEKGVKFKALEMPGLWNGSMAHWNTIFVELPLKVFNPVKIVSDLLRREHQNNFSR
ncbi:MAG: DUF4301 family protein [Smithella sp.]